jgi:PKHD-type hydroxylase
MITIRNLLTPEEVETIRTRLAGEAFVHGGETAHGRAKKVKNNLQLPDGGQAERELEKLIISAFDRNPTVRATALPLRAAPARFSKYEAGMEYGWHVDSPVMAGGGSQPVRTDLACTVFLSDPKSYGGGELTIQTPLGTASTKLPAGDAILYPATTVHRVEPVTHGVRQVALLWVQSMIASAEQRQLLSELAQATAKLRNSNPEAKEIDTLLGVHANLVRMWSHT